MAAQTYLDMLANATLDTYIKKAVNNFLLGSTLLSFLTLSGRMKNQAGGENVVHPILYGYNPTFGYYSYYDEVDIDPTGGLYQASYALKNAVVAVTISRDEERKNLGKNKIVDLLSTKFEQALDTMTDKVAESLFKSTPGSSKEIIGLPALVTYTTPTDGTYTGALDENTYDWWAPKRITASPTAFGTTGIKNMRKIKNDTAFGNDTMDVYFCGQSAFEALEAEADAKERINVPNNKLTKSMVSLGFDVVEFKGRPVIYDRNHATASVMYALNTKHIYMTYDSGTWFFRMPFESTSAKQMAKTSKILVSMALNSDSLRTQGVIGAMTF